ncbi:MAG: DUF1508 domain-containing protein [Candidatus Bathyarchaeota archaeon]
MSFEVYKDKVGEFRWRLKGPSQKIIADSGEGYKTKVGCEEGLAAVRKNAPTAKLVDLTK